ncbi:hypothetical protein CDAR_205711 [Caerostris darwini]|uniref:Uncharacterized protein n=1 Tax=Caerostris darwini TaxID=1538125 RepID=A0AAV4WW55_9ARAC|nr:hypothetical protein CDAR_205711 [Caerostris darwini]
MEKPRSLEQIYHGKQFARRPCALLTNGEKRGPHSDQNGFLQKLNLIMALKSQPIYGTGNVLAVPPKSKWMEAAPPVRSAHPRPPNRLFLERAFIEKWSFPPNQITPHQPNPHRHLASDEHW